jgi:hypothetical protein
MRHFLLFAPIARLPFSMPMTAGQTALVALSGIPHATFARCLRTGVIAVAIASVAVTANHHRRAAASAQIASSGRFHRQVGPMDLDGNARFVTYFACNVASWLRAWRWF